MPVSPPTWRTWSAAFPAVGPRRRWRPPGGSLVVLAGLTWVFVGHQLSACAIGPFQDRESQKGGLTRLSMNQLGQLTMTHMMMNGNKAPGSLQDVEGVKENMLVDGWGREFEFVAPGPGNEPFDIVSYGRDGSDGGSGLDADIRYSESK